MCQNRLRYNLVSADSASSGTSVVDQIPEALLPLLLVKADFLLDGWSLIVILAAFCVTEWCLSYLVDRLALLGIEGD